MATTDLAKAYVQIIPSTKDFSANLTAALAPELAAAGTTAGSGLGAGLAAGASAAGLGLAAAGTAAVAFGTDAVKAGMDFDTAMSQVQATLLTDAEGVQELREFAMQMGASTKFTATEAAQALNYMALAGYDAETSMEMLPTVLNLAAAGGIDLAYASDMVTDAQTALGLTMDQTKTLVDQMAQTASKSNTSVAQLGDAMLTIGGTAQYMSGGTEELTAVLGVLADNGIKASEGGTHLRNILLKLVDPTADGEKALEDLGVQIYDTDGKMRSFTEIFPELADAMDNLTEEDRLNFLSKIFNSRDIAAANALLSTSKDRWDDLGTAIDGAKGAAEEMAEIQMDNLEGSVTKLKSAYEGLEITISKNLNPTLQKVVDNATLGVQQINALLSGGLEAYRQTLKDQGLFEWGGYIEDTSSSGHSFSYGGRDLSDDTAASGGYNGSTAGGFGTGTVNNIYVENLQTVNQVLDMIENDNRRRRMS